MALDPGGLTPSGEERKLPVISITSLEEPPTAG